MSCERMEQRWLLQDKKISTDVRMKLTGLGTIMSIYLRLHTSWAWGMIKNDMNSKCHHEETPNQVTTQTTEEKNLQKIQKSLTKIFENSLGELFERCFISNGINAFEVEEYQRLTELAAKFSVSIDEVKKTESFLKEKALYLSHLQTELSKDIPNLRGKNKRKRKKRLKRELRIVSTINKAFIAIVEGGWWCLSLKQKEYLENLTTSLAVLAPEYQARSILRDLENFASISPMAEVQLDFYLTATKLIQTVINADDEDTALTVDEDPDLVDQFLDFLDNDIIKYPSELVPYTEEMDLELNELLDGIEVD